MSADSLAARSDAVRRGAGLFPLPKRGVIQVTGSERIRWLDGMLTNDVLALEARGPGAGCHALLLTPQGRIVVDLHVLLAADSVWLELERDAIPTVIERLERFLIADDVSLRDGTDTTVRLALEGPRAAEVLAACAGREREPGFSEHAWQDVQIGDVPVRVAGWAFTSGPGLQLFAPPDRRESLVAALHRAGKPCGLVDGDAALLELLRIEAGTPWLGSELDESVLPAEVRLDRAVSDTKGCYTGQEVVARMRSRDRVRSLLVGLCLEGGDLPEPGAKIEVDGRPVGELTSAVRSPRFGAIALGFVRREHAEPGTRVRVAGADAQVSSLPFDEREAVPS